jgi:MtN3 and saliva related transmembrane protein
MYSPQWVAVLGGIAGFCTTFAFVPQLVKIYRQGGRDLSYATLSFYLFGVLLWLAYGIIMRVPAVALTNLATAILIASATLLKAWKERQQSVETVVIEQLAERS